MQPLRNSVLVLIALALPFLASSCGGEKNDEPSRPQYEGPPLTTGQAGYNNGVLYAPEAEIVSRGQIYTERLECSDNELVGIVLGDSAYLFFTGFGDSAVSLSDSSSSISLATALAAISFGFNGGGQLRRETLRLDDDWTLPTGLGVSALNADQYQISNRYARWAAIVPAGSQPEFLMPDEIDAYEWVRDIVLPEGFPHKSTGAVVSRDVSVETFGSSFRYWILPTISGLLQLDYNSLVEAHGRNLVVMGQLESIECVMALNQTLDFVVGVRLPNECITSLIGFLAPVFRNLGVMLAIGDAATKEIWTEQVGGALNSPTSCTLQWIVDLSSEDPSYIKAAKVARKIFKIFAVIDLTQLAANYALGHEQTLHGKFYAPLTTPFSWSQCDLHSLNSILTKSHERWMSNTIGGLYPKGVSSSTCINEGLEYLLTEDTSVPEDIGSGYQFDDRPNTASQVLDLTCLWDDECWMTVRRAYVNTLQNPPPDRPLTIDREELYHKPANGDWAFAQPLNDWQGPFSQTSELHAISGSRVLLGDRFGTVYVATPSSYSQVPLNLQGTWRAYSSEAGDNWIVHGLDIYKEAELGWYRIVPELPDRDNHPDNNNVTPLTDGALLVSEYGYDVTHAWIVDPFNVATLTYRDESSPIGPDDRIWAEWPAMSGIDRNQIYAVFPRFTSIDLMRWTGSSWSQGPLPVPYFEHVYELKMYVGAGWIRTNLRLYKMAQ